MYHATNPTSRLYSFPNQFLVLLLCLVVLLIIVCVCVNNKWCDGMMVWWCDDVSVWCVMCYVGVGCVMCELWSGMWCVMWWCGCGMVVSHILEDLYNLARSSGPPVVGIESEIWNLKYASFLISGHGMRIFSFIRRVKFASHNTTHNEIQSHTHTHTHHKVTTHNREREGEKWEIRSIIIARIYVKFWINRWLLFSWRNRCWCRDSFHFSVSVVKENFNFLLDFSVIRNSLNNCRKAYNRIDSKDQNKSC